MHEALQTAHGDASSKLTALTAEHEALTGAHAAAARELTEAKAALSVAQDARIAAEVRVRKETRFSS